MARRKKPMVIRHDSPTQFTRHLVTSKTLDPIKRDAPKLVLEQPWNINELRDAVAERSEGGLIYREDLPTHLTYFIYNDLDNKRHTYVGHDAVHFYPPFRDKIPSVLSRPEEFSAFIKENPNAYDEWDSAIKRDLKRHPDCRCVFNGGSWHLNLQECLCEGKTLDDAMDKTLDFIRGKRTF